MDTSTKHTTWLSVIALSILSLVALPFGCSGSTGDSASDSMAVSQSTDDDHGHEHDDDEHGHEHGDEEGHDDDHGHEHADDDDGHEHGEEGEHDHEHSDADSPDTVEGLLHAIADTHKTIETADTDEKLLDAHHAPYEIRDYLTKLQSMLELSDEDAAEYAKLLERIGQQADLVEKHSHDEEVEMVRAIVEKLNANIEAIEKIAGADHDH